MPVVAAEGYRGQALERRTYTIARPLLDILVSFSPIMAMSRFPFVQLSFQMHPRVGVLYDVVRVIVKKFLAVQHFMSHLLFVSAYELHHVCS